MSQDKDNSHDECASQNHSAKASPKAKKGKVKPLTATDILKWEITQELCLSDKVRDGGWGSLTAAESGRIGGLIAKRKKG